ncbi:hypothetical protein AB0B56_01345 [Streptosporangium canum]|uniref:hypothetical protein n=1 Tax=Streptosporangium canum TaxID=324952 RepID=UPI0034432DA8
MARTTTRSAVTACAWSPPDSAETLDIPVAREPVRLRDDDVLIGREPGIPAPANEVLGARPTGRPASSSRPAPVPRALAELIDAHAAAVSGRPSRGDGCRIRMTAVRAPSHSEARQEDAHEWMAGP